MSVPLSTLLAWDLWQPTGDTRSSPDTLLSRISRPSVIEVTSITSTPADHAYYACSVFKRQATSLSQWSLLAPLTLKQGTPSPPLPFLLPLGFARTVLVLIPHESTMFAILWYFLSPLPHPLSQMRGDSKEPMGSLLQKPLAFDSHLQSLKARDCGWSCPLPSSGQKEGTGFGAGYMTPLEKQKGLGSHRKEQIWGNIKGFFTKRQTELVGESTKPPPQKSTGQPFRESCQPRISVGGFLMNPQNSPWES